MRMKVIFGRCFDDLSCYSGMGFCVYVSLRKGLFKVKCGKYDFVLITTFVVFSILVSKI